MYSNKLLSTGTYPILTDFNRPVYCLMGLPVDAVSEIEAVSLVAQAASRGERCFFSTPNLNFLIASLHDPAFRGSVLRSNLSVADGMPLVWMARMLGLPIQERVAGSSMFESLRSHPSAPSVYFFGGPPGVAESASRALNSASTGSRCVGFYSPGFGTIEQMSSADVIEGINRSGAQLLVVALGAKKGQLWIEYNLSRLQVPAVSHLGAVVNFSAGTVARAPRILGRLGLEWLWRIKEEPTLWRRYWTDGIAFAKLMLRYVLPTVVERMRPPSAASLSAAAAQCIKQQCGVSVVLSGALHGPAQMALREACHAAATASVDVLLDLTALESLDQAALGVLLLLYGHQSKLGLGWRLKGASLHVQRLLSINGAEYLMHTLPLTNSPHRTIAT